LKPQSEKINIVQQVEAFKMIQNESSTKSSGESLHEKFLRGRLLVEESSYEQAVALLVAVQQDIQARGLFSANETVEDISTKSLPFLAIDHFLALAMVGLPIQPGQMAERKKVILRSVELWSNFIMKLEQLELLSKEEVKEYYSLSEDVGEDFLSRPLPPPSRDAKIARFKAKQQTKKEMERLRALRDRRQRCGVSAEEEIDGFDDEGLERTLALQDLNLQKAEALEQWAQTKQELPMIEMMADRGRDSQQMKRYAGEEDAPSDESRSRPLSGKPLEVTRITKDAGGQLQIKREEIRSTVFRPGWNQPTMSLEELGEREYQAAIEREARQKEAEANQKNEPRKYEDLVRDGMEDNLELVDASAKLDRDWDDFKDANPRGSGNKHANRGDKNF
jgi:immunoglobulin-binding protein 1